MRPDVRKYDNYRHFLKDHMVWMCGEDRKYSLRWIAQRAGFSSPSMLSMVVSGQRALPRERIAGLAEVLKLLPDEAEYLRLIFELEHCEDPKEKKRLETILLKDHKGGLFCDPEDDGYEVFSQWYLPAMRELVELKDFRADPFWIAGKLQITPIEARDGLTTLLRIGMVDVKDGKYRRSQPSIQPTTSMSKAKMDQFNKAMSERATTAIGLTKDHRYFNCLTVAVSQETFRRIPEILARLIAEVDMLAESDAKRDEVAQLNVQFFSLTERVTTPVSLPLTHTNTDKAQGATK